MKQDDANDTLKKHGVVVLRERLAKAKPFTDEHQDDDIRPQPFTDDGLALRFGDKHAEHLRFVAAWNRWPLFDGTRWEIDETKRVFHLSRQVCRQAAAECNKAKTASAISSARTVAAVLTMAQSDRRIAATTDQWDADPWLLNTPKGTVDLRDGEIREHRPEDYLTKITGIAPDANCQTPVWLNFLDDITREDADLIAYLRRTTGYALTGVTVEHAMFFLYGLGSNGKTTFINTVTSCMGEHYHRTAPIETFTEAKNDRHPTELAGLRGARLVTAMETEEGRRWAESKIKALTGGDKISARFMRQDFFEFVPQFKLMIGGNHKPTLKTVDEAIKRRFHLVPFDVTIPEERRDKKLMDKLQTELPGILWWMIEGCLEWQRKGLSPPKSVTKATAEYLEAQDALSAWIDERCARDPMAETNRTSLFADWSLWASNAGEDAGNAKTFYQRLEDKGFEQGRANNMRSGCDRFFPYRRPARTRERSKWKHLTQPDTANWNSAFRLVHRRRTKRKDQTAPCRGPKIMDVTRFFGARFLKVDDVKASGPIVVKIVGIAEGQYGKPNLTFEDGTMLSVNATNGRMLMRAYGAESNDWVGKEIELAVGKTQFQGEVRDSVLVKPISPPVRNKKPPKPSLVADPFDQYLNDPIPEL
jgi:putative DNA primase/helicase